LCYDAKLFLMMAHDEDLTGKTKRNPGKIHDKIWYLQGGGERGREGLERE
jgi:hypothetical protein